MKIAKVDLIPVSIPYTHVEMSARVARQGVSDVVVRMETDDGLVGWGECCSGADTASVAAAARAMLPFVIGKDPRNGELVRKAVFQTGLWDYRLHTGNFAYAGIDMAMLDIAARALGAPLWRLLGGLASTEPVSYFYYLQRADEADLARQCSDALAHGYRHFYLKVGLEPEDDERMLRAVRRAIGPGSKLRIDANEAWTQAQAAKLLTRWDAEFDLDFIEAPVRAHPIRLMADFKRKLPLQLCANEGLDGENNVMEVIHHAAADVLCFSSYWVGSLSAFITLSRTAGLAGITVCKHTHGEFGIAAAAHQQALLTIGNGIGGHQQTASVLADDIVTAPLPIATGPSWQASEAPGLGIAIDRGKLDFYHRAFEKDGQFLPWAGAN